MPDVRRTEPLSAVRLDPTMLGAVAGVTAVIVVYRDTFASLVSVWLQSATFNHCFLIAPITAYLIWRRRESLARAPKEVSPIGLAAMVVLSVGWFVAAAADVQFGEQLMAVALIPAAVLSILGRRATKLIAFPLAFLMFSVPFGEWLVQPLMDFTANFVVVALKATGIPVAREGVFFSIPSGDFEVAKGCSGIRYLIATVAIGTLYAWQNYRSLRKRAAFLALSVVLPIIANGIRAYLIVMIAHLSDMRLAVGVDHLVYGALFFALLIVLLFWLGGKFRDPEAGEHEAAEAPAVTPTPVAPVKVAGGLVVLLLAAAAGPLSLHAWTIDEAEGAALNAHLPVMAGEWRGPGIIDGDWRTLPEEAIEELRGAYDGPQGSVEVDLIASRAIETVGLIDSLVSTQRWQVVEKSRIRSTAERGDSAFREVVLRSNGRYRVVWYHYRVGGTNTEKDWLAKILEARSSFFGTGSAATLVLISTAGGELSLARTVLDEFVREHSAILERCLEREATECTDKPT